MERRYFVALVVAGLLVLLACAGFALPITLPVYFAIGWAIFLYRVLPNVRIDAGGVAMGTVCLLLFAAGAHAFLGWLYDQIQKSVPPHGRWKPRWTAALAAAVVLMFVAGMATAGITHQVGWLLTSREPWFVSGTYQAARRSASVNNLKQMALALGNYAERYQTFPPGGTFDAMGQPLHSWMTRILPFIEQETLYLYGEIDLRVPWNDPRNAPFFQKRMYIFINPGIRINEEMPEDTGFAPSHYAGNVHVLGGDRALAPADIQDGAGQTIMAGEAPGRFKAWGNPTNWRDPAKGINRAPEGFGGPYTGGANFNFADGSVRFLKNGIHPRVFQALSTPAGGETVSSEEY